jgi:hypothetical protein
MPVWLTWFFAILVTSVAAFDATPNMTTGQAGPTEISQNR